MRFKKSILFMTLVLVVALCISGGQVKAATVNPALEKLHNPTHTCSTDVYEHKSCWSCVYFGSYPQSVVTDTKLQDAIDAQLIANGSFAGKAKYVVGDCVVNGVKYRKIRIGDTYNSSNFKKLYVTDEDNLAESYAYFRFDPIKWRVLKIDKANNKMFIMANNALDTRGHGGGDPWWESEMREFLNCYNECEIEYPTALFYQFKPVAFNQMQQDAIIPTSGISGRNLDMHYQTVERNKEVTDDVFLLSWEQIHNQSYGFCPQKISNSSRVIWCTDYALARGCDASVSGVQKQCPWWLCTDDGSYNWAAYCASEYGKMCVKGSTSANGVVPAMWISLDSLQYSYAGETYCGNNSYVYEGKIFPVGNQLYQVRGFEDLEVHYVGSRKNNVTKLNIPATVQHCGYRFKVTEIKGDVHNGDKKLKSVTIGSNVKMIENGAFENCKNLKSVVIGKNVVTISSRAFANCKKLSSVKFGKKVNRIVGEAFMNCKSLKSAKLGPNVTSIGDEAFFNCSKLKKVTIQSKKLSYVGDNAFSKIAKKSTITVPKKYKKKKYKRMFINTYTKNRTKIKYK